MLRPLGVLFLFLIASCSVLNEDLNDQLTASTNQYKQLEVSGEYLVDTMSGFNKNHEYVRKTQIISPVNRSKVYERTIVISKRKKISNDLFFLVPIKYESTFYLNNDVYTVSGQVDLKRRKILYNLNSPEYKWLGQREYDVPQGVKAICFYSSIIECAKVSGFIKKAIEKKNGDMNFHILWESFPYFQEQYLNIPKEILSEARLSFDEFDKKGNYRFLLAAGGQEQVYILNKNLDVVGHYWASQGLSKELVK